MTRGVNDRSDGRRPDEAAHAGGRVRRTEHTAHPDDTEPHGDYGGGQGDEAALGDPEDDGEKDQQAVARTGNDPQQHTERQHEERQLYSPVMPMRAAIAPKPSRPAIELMPINPSKTAAEPVPPTVSMYSARKTKGVNKVIEIRIDEM